MKYGTIFEVLKTKAVRHRVPQATKVTVCGKDMRKWKIYHELPKETRCEECYPWQKKKK